MVGITEISAIVAAAGVLVGVAYYILETKGPCVKSGYSSSIMEPK